MFDNTADANMRLSDSVIRLQGSPIYIHEAVRGPDREIQLVYTDLEGVGGRVGVHNEHLNYEPVPLGYVNIDGMSAYLQRIPARKWKQGLSRDNLQIKGILPDFIDTRALLTTSYLAATIQGTYPTFAEALTRVREGRDQHTAFHRKFSLHPDSETGLVWLHYAGDRHGWVEGSGAVVLGNRSQYLLQELENAL